MFVFCGRPADALLSSEPGGGQGNLTTHIVAQDFASFCFSFFVTHVILSSLCCAFSARHFPPSQDCRMCHPSISCWFSPFFVSPPRHAGGPREGFDVGVPDHSACVSSIAFLRLAPPATLAVRRRFLTVVCLIIAPAFSFNWFLYIFPGFIA